jgi:hypothetical protein
MGDSAFSPKTKSPWRLLHGAPPKRSRFLGKIFILQMLKTSRPGSLAKKTRDASSQRAKTDESGTAYASNRI